jgi:hypothetical protein
MTSNLKAGSGEFVSDWGFNLKTSFTDFSKISFSPVSDANASFADTTSAGAALTFNPASIGKFNIFFDWTGSNHAFGPGGVVVYDLIYTGAQTFNASLFNATSDNGAGSYFTAAKIQGIPPSGQSGELGNTTGPTVTAVPEPGTTVLAFTGLISLGALGMNARRRSRAA